MIQDRISLFCTAVVLEVVKTRAIVQSSICRRCAVLLFCAMYLCASSNLAAQQDTSTRSTDASVQAPVSTSPTPAQAQITAPEAYKLGVQALERQYFRPAADAFRTASILDPANTMYLHQFAKALFYAEGKNRDSVRFANELMNLYTSLGKESSALQVQKAQILKSDIEQRLEALLQDSLKAAQREAAKYGFEYGYKARLRPPPEKKTADSSLAGQTDWRISAILSAGLYRQANAQLDQWASGGVDIRGGAWFPLGESIDWGFDAALSLRIGGIVEQSAQMKANDSAISFKRIYDAGATLRLRFSPRSTLVLGLLGCFYGENPQSFRTRDNEAWQPLRLYTLAGGGLFLEPRIGTQGIVLEGRYYAVGIIGTPSASRMITAALGYGFGSAEILAEGSYAERPEASMIVANIPTNFYARLTLRWHIVQAVNVPSREAEK